MLFVFNLKCHVSDSDPADPNTIRWRDWLVLGCAEENHAFWDRAGRDAEQANRRSPWGPIVHIVDNWLRLIHTQIKEYVRFSKSRCSKMGISGISESRRIIKPSMRWAHLRGKSLGLNLTTSPLSADFMALYPEELLSEDFEEIQRQHGGKRLADTVAKQAFLGNCANSGRLAGPSGIIWPSMATKEFGSLPPYRDLCT